MADYTVSIALVADAAKALNPLNAVEKSLGGLQAAASGPVKAIKGLTDALGSIGLAAQGVQALAGAASGLGSAFGVGLANTMEVVRAQLLAFTKDGATADQILKDIRAEADRTPFAFQEMAKATASLLPAAKQSGVGLMELVKQAEILAALNPAEGLEGAAFSLREALSGDFVSIVERFNLPRDAINKLKAEGVPALEIVSRALQGMGADASLVGNIAQTTSGRFSTFQDAIDGLRVESGKIVLEQLGVALDKLSAALEANRPALTEFARLAGDFLGRAVELGTDALLGLVAAAQRFAPTVRLIGDTLTALVHGDFANFANGARQLVQGAIDSLAGAFSAFAPTGERLGELFGFIGERIADLTPLAQAVGQRFDDAGGAAGTASGLIDALAGVINGLSAAVEGAVGFLQDHHQALVNLGGIVTTVTAGVAAYRAVVLVTTAAQGLAAAATAAWAAVTQGLPALLLAARGAMIALNVALAANPIGLVVAALAALAAALVYAYNTNETFRNAVNAAWEAIKGAVLAAVKVVQDAIAALGAWFQAQGGTFGGAAAAVGKAIVDGIGNAIAGGIAWVKQKAAELAQAALDGAKAALGIASPSREFEEVGEQLVAGFTAGIEQNAQDAAEAVGQMAEATLDSVANALGAVFEKTFSLVEQAQNEIDNARADADRAMYRAEELEGIKHGRRMAELERDLGAATGKARQAVQEKIADEQRAHLQRLEDIQRQHDDKIVELEFDAADKIAAAQRKQNEARGAALRDFQRGIDDATRDAERSLQALNERVAAQLQEAFDDAVKAADEARNRAAQQIQDLTEGRALDLSIRVRREAFDTTQDAESLTRSRTREDAENEYRFKEDLADAERDLNKDLQKAKTDEDRARIRERYQDTLADLRQRFEDAKRDLAHRRQLEDEDREYRRQQAKKLQDFNDGLEREALQRSIARINEDARTRVTEIGKALAEKQRQIETQANKERETLAQSLRDRVADLEAHLREKIGPLLADEETMLTTWLGGIAEKVGGLVGKIMTDTAAALAKPLPAPSFDAGGLSTAQNPTRWGGISDATQEAFRQNVAAADPGRDTRPRNPDGTIAGVPTPRLPNGEIDWGKVNARATGGPVRKGEPVWTGEVGPELFVPASDGYILPAGTMSRGGVGMGSGGWNGGAYGQPISVTINLPNATVLGSDKERLAREWADAMYVALLEKQRRSGGLGLG